MASKQLTRDAPQFSGSGGVFRVRHREYFEDINQNNGAGFPATGSPYNAVFPINPGNSDMFPWLSTIANQFQQYRVNGMVIEYRSLCGVVSTSISLGTVTMATEYNSSAPPFTTREQMLNTDYHNDGKPSEDIIHPIECSARETTIKNLYVNPSVDGTVPSGQDPRFYNLGTFTIVNFGNPNNVGLMGELYVTYDITLLKPILNPAISAPAYVSHYQLTTPTAAAPLGTGTPVKLFDPLALCCQLSSVSQSNGAPTGTKLYLNPAPGNYLMFFVWTGSATAACVAPGLTLTNGMAAYNDFDAQTAAGYSVTAPSSNSATTSCWASFSVTPAQASACAAQVSAGNPATPTWVNFGTSGTVPGGTVIGDVFLFGLPTGA